MTGRLIFIGLGLNDEKDITLKGIEAVKGCEFVFAEFYTSILSATTVEALESIIGKKIKVIKREGVEDGNEIIEKATHGKVALLVPGDPLVATTHVSLRLSAMEKGIETEIIHNASIITAAAGVLGLQQYKFGRTTSIAFPEEKFRPESSYDALVQNREAGLHTLILLDLRPDEGRFMSAGEGMKVLLNLESEHNKGVFTGETVACIVARLGSKIPVARAGRVMKLLGETYGPPLHSIVVPGKLHFMEEEALRKIAGLE